MMMKDDLGYDVYGQKRFGDTKQATIVALTFGRARVNLSLRNPADFDDCW